MTDDDVRQWHEQGLSELRAAFDLFDTNHDGRLDADELHTALVELGQPAEVDEVRQLIASVQPPAHRRASIGFDGFVALVEPTPDGLDPEADLRATFALLDRDGDGFLTASELRAGPTGLGAEEARRVVRVADADGDGRLSFEEFRAVMAKAS